MKTILAFLVTAFLLVGCGQPEPSEKKINKEEIETNIKDLGGDVVWALNEANMDTLIKDFWQSEDALFMIDGMTIKGYSNIENVIRSLPQRRKNLELNVDNEEVIIYSKDLAVHIVQFNETVTLNNDSTYSDTGVWSSLFQKIDGEWKTIMVHESHRPLEE